MPKNQPEENKSSTAVRKTDVDDEMADSDAPEPNVQYGEKPKSFEMDGQDNNTDEEMRVF